MIKHQKAINYIGWILGILTSVLYILCIEPTLSFWDSGEYILTSSKLEVGHPPGAPLFQIFGAFFSIFAFGNPHLVAILLNSMSAIFSGATICFLFWIIVRLLSRFSNKHIGNIIAAIIGSLVFAFSDTFWNSAIETEVYSFSIFLTTLNFWAILKWDSNPNGKWIIFICFIIGLSIGVHLLSILVIPSICLIIYFHYKKGSFSSVIKTLIISCLILALILWGIIPIALKLISINPYIIILTIVILIVALIIFSTYKKKPLLNTSILSLAFFLIGYSTFFVLVIRAKSDTPINEYKPDNAKHLESYLNREAYGKTPLIYGPSYTAMPPKEFKITPQNGIEPIFERQMMMFFPRMWNYNNPNYEAGYTDWVGVNQDTIIIDGAIRSKPSWMQNLKFFISYQVGYMYVRYLLWNFVGRTNDQQGFGDKHQGQWIVGIDKVDKLMKKNIDTTPKYRENKAHNIYYGIPFILAIIGLFYLIGKDVKTSVSLLTLFFFTGLAIVVYLNEYAYQPRERDYAYVGSFMVFSIWIAMGAFCISQFIVNIIRIKKPKYVLPCFILVPALMFANNFDDHNRSYRYSARNFAYSILNSCEENAILFVNADNDTFPLWYLQEVEKIRRDVRIINLNLLNDASYIEKLTNKVYDSYPIKLSAKKNIYNDVYRSVCFVMPNTKNVELKTALEYFYSEKSKMEIGNYTFYSLLSNKLSITINDTTKINFILDQSELSKSTVILYDIIANNLASRPIYFSSYSIDDSFAFKDYLSLEGFSSRLKTEKQKPQNSIVESKVPSVNTKKMYENFKTKYQWRNFNKQGIYYDELHRSIIELFYQQASLLSHCLFLEGYTKESVEIADLILEKIPPKIHQYPYCFAEIALIYEQVNNSRKAEELMYMVIDYFNSQMNYYMNLSDIEKMQNRLEAQKIISSWINLCEITENSGMENLRVLLSDNIFNYLSPFYSICFNQLERLSTNMDYYSSDIDALNQLIDEIDLFAKRYEEKLQ
ncbi:MAG: DUF2723 domain-containing protein [Bacteroidales bacterium]|jgi:hypothetical protein|nr:DUF2723 domain-containing protein [Bacteroidales bacterium]